MAQEERPAPEYLDVLVVGAGLSGVGAAHHLRTACPWASFAVLEARGDIGGTWDLFRYPGVRSDSDMHTLGYAFRPWEGDTSIADGASILEYIRGTATSEGVDSRVRFHHRVVAADWSSAESRWHVQAERTDTGEVVELHCGFLFSCTGYYRYDHGYLPDFDGMDEFGGTVVHPQAWPQDLEVAGRRVVVIGSGATAVTLVPALAQRGAQVTMVQRSPSYIGAIPEKNPVVALLRRLLPPRTAGTAAKWVCALETQAFYRFCRLFPGAARRLVVKGARDALPDGYDVATHFSPTYAPWDQRFCAAPGGDFFAAIRDGHARGAHRGDRALHRLRPAAGLRRGARSRHRRHRHRPRDALPRRHDAAGGRTARRPGGAPGVQGHDARGRAQPGLRRGVHQRVVDTQVRPHL